MKMHEQRRNQQKRKRSCAARKIMKERRAKGYFNTLIPTMRMNDDESFKNFHRMDARSFDELVAIFGPYSRRPPLRWSEEITLHERLAVTLRYLASGDSMKSIGYYGFRIGAATTSHIIKETCQLIWERLQSVFPAPSEDIWHKVVEEFYEKSGFPNCLGAIDGKHVVVQAFPNHNSLTFNYKHTHSIVLMAVADANYKFLMLDIGALGHNSDGGVFKTSKFGNSILNNPSDLYIPNPKPLLNSNEEAPFVFVADEAFPLRTNIMRPYSGRNVTILPPDQALFNKRLSRARRVVENSFGILDNRFRIYRRPIIACKATANNIVKATVCLHNWLVDKNGSVEAERYISAESENNLDHDGMVPLGPTHNNHAARDALRVRQQFTSYFSASV